MTHQPLTKAEREELGRLHAEAELNKNGDWEVECDEAFRVACMDKMFRLLADLDAAEADARELRDILRRHNFAPCDTAACNCNGWHERSTGNGFYARFQEIDEAVGEHDGQTLLDAVKQIVAERKAAVLWAEKAEKAMTCKGCGGTVSDHLAPDQGGCPGLFEIDGVQMVPLEGRNEAVAQRERAEAERDALKAKLDDPRRVLIHETEVVATKEEIATLRSERDMFASWIAMEHRGSPDWACAQCKPPSHGNDMVVEGFVCVRHQAMAIAAARGGAQ